MDCYIQHQIAENADLSVVADREEIINEEAVKDFVVNRSAEFSNGEIDLYEAQDFAEEKHYDLYREYVLDAIQKCPRLTALMKVAALELNEQRGNNH